MKTNFLSVDFDEMDGTIYFVMGLREALENELLETIGYSVPVSVQEDQTVRKAVELMRRKAVGCLLVLRGEDLKGIFTERDLLHRVLGNLDSYDLPISDFMSTELFAVRVDEPIHRVLTRMHAGGMRHLPVVDMEDRPVGIISVKTAVHFLIDHHSTTVYNLPPDPNQFPSSQEGG